MHPGVSSKTHIIAPYIEYVSREEGLGHPREYIEMIDEFCGVAMELDPSLKELYYRHYPSRGSVNDAMQWVPEFLKEVASRPYPLLEEELRGSITAGKVGFFSGAGSVLLWLAYGHSAGDYTTMAPLAVAGLGLMYLTGKVAGKRERLLERFRAAYRKGIESELVRVAGEIERHVDRYRAYYEQVWENR